MRTLPEERQSRARVIDTEKRGRCHTAAPFCFAARRPLQRAPCGFFHPKKCKNFPAGFSRTRKSAGAGKAPFAPSAKAEDVVGVRIRNAAKVGEGVRGGELVPFDVVRHRLPADAQFFCEDRLRHPACADRPGNVFLNFLQGDHSFSPFIKSGGAQRAPPCFFFGRSSFVGKAHFSAARRTRRRTQRIARGGLTQMIFTTLNPPAQEIGRVFPRRRVCAPRPTGRRC